MYTFPTKVNPRQSAYTTSYNITTSYILQEFYNSYNWKNIFTIIVIELAENRQQEELMTLRRTKVDDSAMWLYVNSRTIFSRNNFLKCLILLHTQ